MNCNISLVNNVLSLIIHSSHYTLFFKNTNTKKNDDYVYNHVIENFVKKFTSFIEDISEMTFSSRYILVCTDVSLFFIH